MRKTLVFIGCLIVSLDQITKVLALKYFVNQHVEVIPGFFRLTLVLNKGAAFGLFSNFQDDVRRIFLGVVTSLAILLLLKFLKEVKGDFWSELCLFFVLSGAISNLFDRLRQDAVVDFLDFYLGSYHWPAFNVADSAISIGVCFLLVRLFFFKANTQ